MADYWISAACLTTTMASTAWFIAKKAALSAAIVAAASAMNIAIMIWIATHGVK